jgi:hypothetical protein
MEECVAEEELGREALQLTSTPGVSGFPSVLMRYAT